MAVTIEQFIQGLEQCGIISPDNLRSVCEKLPPARQRDVQELARELVRQKLLTTYQVKEAYQGKAKDLVLGNYTILDQIGQGGMGQVFKAQHRKMKRLVAIKLLPAAMTKDQAAINRFQREVEAAAKLRHPNIVAADDADEAAGRHFLVMEYVEGQDLSALVKKDGPLPVDHAVGCVLQAARGLEYAHRRGVVHRDIKPANLLLDLEGTVKIFDMGLARLESAAGAEHAELTGTGQIMGTVDYMAPEQALNTKHADQRADIYSLGITLWYLLTGRAVFSGETVMEKLLAHREQPIPSLQTACPGATPALQAVFTKMVAKKAEDRFQSMSEVVAEFERFHRGPSAAGWSSDDQVGDHRSSEYVRSTSPSRATSGRTSAEPAVATKRPLTAVLEATMTMAGSEIGTNPKTEQSLLVPDAGLRASVRRPHRLLVVCAAGAVAFLLAGIVFYVQTKDGTIRVEINDPQIEVTIKGSDIVLKQADRGTDITLSSGDHTLIVRRGDFTFETNRLVLKKGDTVTVHVELLDGQVEVKQGDKVIGQAKLPDKPSVAKGRPFDAPKTAIAPFNTEQAREYQEAWAKFLKVPVEHTNSIGMKFVLIPPGEFTMGSTAAEIEDALKVTSEDKRWQDYIKSETPQHKVILTQPIYLGVYEVTQAEYTQVMGRNPSFFAKTGPENHWVEKVAGLETASHPVEGVSWNDAVEFCTKLSEQEKLKSFYFHSGETITMQEGTGYRLPTEAHWEFACRAGTTTRYWMGDKDDDLPQAAWFALNSDGRTHRVGELRANPFGLYDIHGNVWEWVQDGWEPAYYGQFQEKPALDPSGPTSANSERVYRGGDWNNDLVSRCRASLRLGKEPTYRFVNIGFRVSLPVDAVKRGSSKQPDIVNSGWHSWPADAPKPAIAPFDAKPAEAHQEAWAKHLGTKVEIENSLGMKLRLVPPGEFQLGSPQTEIDALVQSTTEEAWQRNFRSEGPGHSVQLTQAFYLASCELTQRQYQELMGVNPSHFSPTGSGKDSVKDLDTGQHPVEQVSWYDAIDFCNKLSEREQRSPYYARDGEDVKVLGGTGYRLPTEAEWEFACRAGNTTRWSFGDDEQDLTKYAWFNTSAGGRTQRVGELSANPFGLYDMHGNVWEWCWDSHGAYATEAVSDPTTGPVTVGSARVLRGGAFYCFAYDCRSASRFGFGPMIRGPLGFRVCCGR